MRTLAPAFLLAAGFALMASLCLPGCGLGSAGVASSLGGDEAAAPPVATSLQAPRSGTSPASVSFLMVASANASARLEFRTSSGGNFQPATLAAGSASLSSIPSNPTTPYTVLWDFASDLGGSQFRSGVELRLSVQGGNSISLANVAQGNDPPQLSSLQPLPSTQTEFTGNTELSFTFSDSSQDPVAVMVEYNPNPPGFPATSFLKRARPAGIASGDVTEEFQITGLATLATPSTESFIWNTAFNLPDYDNLMVVRVTLQDGFGGSTSLVSAPFDIDNNDEPVAFLQADSFVGSPRSRGVIPIPFQVTDIDNASVRLAVQWAPEGQPFPSLPTTAVGMFDLLANPTRAADRRLAQIATQALPSVEGRVGFLAGLSATEVRLPELASSGAQMLASDLGGATLEVRRLSDAPAAVNWPSSPLTSPVAVLEGDDRYTALVLDQSGSNWRLRLIDLESGAVVRTLASAAGTPRALALDPTRSRVFVGTGANIHLLERSTGAQLGVLAHGFADGPRGLAGISSNSVVASGDSKLARLNVEAGTNITLLSGLSSPFGVARDPLDEQRIYFAETTLNRVRRLDLDRLVAETVSASVATADQAALGTIAFPSPRGIALEANGARLLVMTTVGTTSSLRALELGTSTTIYQVTSGLATSGGAIGTGPDRLRMVPLTTNALALGGGVVARRSLVPTPSSSSDPNQPYDPSRQVVRLASAFSSPLVSGTSYRLVGKLLAVPVVPSSDAGSDGSFRWDSEADVVAGKYRVRVIPFDADIGTQSASVESKSISTLLPASPVAQTAGTLVGAPSFVTTGDLSGDGRADLISTDPVNSRLLISVQSSSGAFSATPIALGTGLSPVSIAVGDMNGDGRLDLVSADQVSNRLSVFFQIAPTPPATAPVFAAATTLTGVSSPRSVVAADLNGDGRLDVAASDFSNNRVAVFFQVAPVPPATQPTFTAAASAFASPGSVFVAAADLSGDGRLDLVSVEQSNNRLAFARQVAPVPPATQPTFTAATTISTGVSPRAVLAVDIDRDGRIDLASADAASNRLSILLQNASGNFPGVTMTLASGVDPVSVAAADFDGDGRIDLASADETSSRLSVFFQLPAASATAPPVFTAAAALTPGTTPQSVTAADLNGDGRADLVSADRGSNRLSVFTQISAGSFPVTPSLPTPGSDPTFVTVADINRDGRADFIATDSFNDRLAIYLQGAAGGFPSTPTTIDTLFDPTCPAATDLDGNGLVDLISVDQSSNSLSIFLQVVPTPPAVPPVFAAPIRVTTQNTPRFVAIADLDGDGSHDIVSADSGSGRLSTYLQVLAVPPATQPTFVANTVLTTGTSPDCVAAADLNGDGRIDLVSADSGSGRLSVFFQVAPTPPATQLAFSAPTLLSTGNSPKFVTAADLNGDGRLDLVSANQNSSNLSIFLQVAPVPPATQPTFPALPTVSTGINPGFVAAADINGDGRIDLVSANSGTGGGLSVLLQSPTGSFAGPPTTLPTGLTPRSVAAVDLNGDGRPELISADQDSGRISIFNNY